MIQKSKILTSTLLLLFLFANIGFTTVLHYCKMESRLFASKPTCGMSCSTPASPNKYRLTTQDRDCCSTKIVGESIEDKYLPVKESVSSEKAVNVFVFSLAPFSLSVENLQHGFTVFTSDEFPPPLGELHILYSSLLL